MLQVTPNTMEISFKIPGNVLFCNLFLFCSVQLAAFLYFGYFPIFGCVTLLGLWVLVKCFRHLLLFCLFACLSSSRCVLSSFCVGHRTLLCVNIVCWCLLVLRDHPSSVRSVCVMRQIRVVHKQPERQSSDLSVPPSPSRSPSFCSETWNASPGLFKLTRSLEIILTCRNIESNEIWMFTLPFVWRNDFLLRCKEKDMFGL